MEETEATFCGAASVLFVETHQQHLALYQQPHRSTSFFSNIVSFHFTSDYANFMCGSYQLTLLNNFFYNIINSFFSF